MDHPAPSLAHLRSELERAERQVACDDRIDNFQRRGIELAKSRAWRDGLRTQIERIEASL